MSDHPRSGICSRPSSPQQQEHAWVFSCLQMWLIGGLCKSLTGIPVLRFAGEGILESSPLGQREAAQRTLQNQGVSILTNALVSRVEASEQPAALEASTSELGKRTVHLKLPSEQSQVGHTPTFLQRSSHQT